METIHIPYNDPVSLLSVKTGKLNIFVGKPKLLIPIINVLDTGLTLHYEGADIKGALSDWLGATIQMASPIAYWINHAVAVDSPYYVIGCPEFQLHHSDMEDTWKILLDIFAEKQVFLFTQSWEFLEALPQAEVHIHAIRTNFKTRAALSIPMDWKELQDARKHGVDIR
jgi:hypothetical protein